MRAAAALVVYMNHSFAQSLTVSPNHDHQPTGWLSAFSYFLVAGHLSVTVFIVISGFCLALPVVRGGDRIAGGPWGFFKRRARRILPPYYGSVLLCLLLIGTVIGDRTGTLWDVPIRVTPVAVISHAFLVQDLFATGSINYVLWSIAVEWHIYLFFPLLVALWRRYGPWLTVSIVMVSSYLFLFATRDTRIIRAMPHFLGMFTLGMLAAYVAQASREPYVTARKRFPWAWTGGLALLTTCLLTGLWGVPVARTRFEYLDFPVAVMAASALVLSSRSENSLLRRMFSWGPLAFVGTFSYSLYLIHAPALQLIWKYILVPRGLDEHGMFLFFSTVGLVVVVGVAYLFFLIVEAPFLRKSSRTVAPMMPAT
jgi:peptidoglycan/LPS O-acetylase OafA/YrhL